MWLRGQSMPVLRNYSTCKKADQHGAHLAIVKLDDNSTSKMRGYQLVVTAGGPTLCSGSELVGIVFQLSSTYGEPAMIRQVAKTPITTDRPPGGVKPAEEYRLMYLVSPAARPDDSLCNHSLNDSRLRRVKRRFFPYHIPEFQQPQNSSNGDNLFEVYKDRLMDYAVIIPNAEYDDRGEPQLQATPKTPRPDELWFEFACAEGALAHTDLTGLVDVDAPQEIRTAAIRMFRAQYDGKDTATEDGTPIDCVRGERPQLPGAVPPSKAAEQDLTNPPDVGDLEAKWDSTGAVCVNHSRLWMRDSIIPDAKPSLPNTPKGEVLKALKQAEDEFIAQFNRHKCTKKDEGYFTSRVVHHIDDTPPTPTSRASAPTK